MKKNLLIKEPPLQVLPSLAKSIGLNEALVLQQLHYWLENPKTGVEIEGHKWIYNTYDEWLEQFPFWSVSTIQRVFVSLEKAELVISQQFDKARYDRKKYYRINYETVESIEDSNLTSSEDSNLTSSLNESESPETTFSPELLSVENQIYAGVKQVTIPEQNQEALTTFERDLQLPANWQWFPAKTTDEKAMSHLRRFVIEQYAKDNKAFEKYQTWRNQPYVKGSMSNLSIKRNPENFQASWSDYLASSAMYGTGLKKTDTRAPQSSMIRTIGQ